MASLSLNERVTRRTWLSQGPGLPLCYTWVEWLQTESLTALGYATSFPVQRVAAALQTATVDLPDATADPAQTPADEGGPAQIAADLGDTSWEKLLVQLLQADAARDFQLFQEVRQLPRDFGAVILTH